MALYFASSMKINVSRVADDGEKSSGKYDLEEIQKFGTEDNALKKNVY
jgi:hypothetical protein